MARSVSFKFKDKVNIRVNNNLSSMSIIIKNVEDVNLHMHNKSVMISIFAEGFSGNFDLRLFNFIKVDNKNFEWAQKTRSSTKLKELTNLFKQFNVKIETT